MKKCIADNPGLGRAHMGLGYAYLGLGQYPQAIEEFEMSAKLDRGDLMSGFGTEEATAFHSGGWPAALRKAIESLESRHKSKTRFVYSYQIAKVYSVANCNVYPLTLVVPCISGGSEMDVQ